MGQPRAATAAVGATGYVFPIQSQMMTTSTPLARWAYCQRVDRLPCVIGSARSIPRSLYTMSDDAPLLGRVRYIAIKI